MYICLCRMCDFLLAEEQMKWKMFFSHTAGSLSSSVLWGGWGESSGELFCIMFSFCFAIHHCLKCPTHPSVKYCYINTGQAAWFAQGERGDSQKNWVGVCGPLPKTLTLFMTRICDIPYPIYDLTKNSKPNLCPDPHFAFYGVHLLGECRVSF